MRMRNRKSTRGNSEKRALQIQKRALLLATDSAPAAEEGVQQPPCLPAMPLTTDGTSATQKDKRSTEPPPQRTESTPTTAPFMAALKSVTENINHHIHVQSSIYAFLTKMRATHSSHSHPAAEQRCPSGHVNDVRFEGSTYHCSMPQEARTAILEELEPSLEALKLDRKSDLTYTERQLCAGWVAAAGVVVEVLNMPLREEERAEWKQVLREMAAWDRSIRSAL